MQHLAAGLLLGLAAAMACLGAASLRRERPVPVAGLALAAATAAGLAVTGAPVDPALGWPALAAITVVVAAALGAFDRRWGRLGLPPALLAVTAAGIWACVPDVEGPLVLVGAVLPMALLGRPGPLAGRWPGAAAFGAAGSAAVAAVLVWVVATGGAGRPGSVVGGLACLGLLGVEPAVRRLDPRRRSPLELLERRPALTWTAVAAQLLLAGIASRVIGRPERVATALGLFLLEFGAALAVGIALVRLPALDRRTHP